MDFFNNPEYNGVKALLLVAVVGVAGFVVYNYSNSPLHATGQVLSPSSKTVSVPRTKIPFPWLQPSAK